jgi:hypothetical protein
MPRVNLFAANHRGCIQIYNVYLYVYIYIYLFIYIECKRQQLVGVVRGYKV